MNLMKYCLILVFLACGLVGCARNHSDLLHASPNGGSQNDLYIPPQMRNLDIKEQNSG